MIVQHYLLSIFKDNHLTNDPPSNDSLDQWKQDDASLVFHIRISKETEVLKLVNQFKNVKDIIIFLEFLYSRVGNASQIYDLFVGLFNTNRHDMPFNNFL